MCSVAVWTRLAATFGDNEGLVAIILERDQGGSVWQIDCLTDHNNLMLNPLNTELNPICQ